LIGDKKKVMKTAALQPKSTASSPPSFFAKEERPSFFGQAAQAKLTVNQPNDPYEKEADAMADKTVQRMESSPWPIETKAATVVQQKADASPPSPITPVQAKCASCEQEQDLQKKEEEPGSREKELQKKPVLDGNATPPDDDTKIERSLAASKGGGSPLPEDTRIQMESSLGADFSGVRIHNNSNAVQMSQQLSAQAFTHGSDIYFNSGKYDTNSKQGKHLLAHELTHTIQQQKSPMVQKAPQDNLASLDQMLDKINVPEDDVIEICGKLSVTERETVLSTPSYKSRMASALNVTEMVQAVTNLQAPFITKLEWIKAASLFESIIDYSDIKTFVTAASQPERDALKTSTTVGKNFFVNVCDNKTMKEALNDLGFDLETKLTWLEAEMIITRLELDYSDIKPWVTAAQQPERDKLKTSSVVGKGFFVTVCTNATMKEALNDLAFDLVTKLTWLEAEMIITRWELDYSDIKPWVTAAPQPERDLLKTDPNVGKSFFVLVCDDKTMIEAVGDLAFDMKIQLEWVNAEGVEFVVKMTWFLDKGGDYDTSKAEILAASKGERSDALADAGLRAVINSKLAAPYSVAVYSHLLLDSMYWQNPTNNEFFAYFVTNGGTGTLPSSTTMNCWESIMYAAYLANKISAAWIKSFYTTALGSGGDPNIVIWSQLKWTPGLPKYPAVKPTIGQLVFYTQVGQPFPGHVAMAIDPDHAISLWNQPNNDYFVQTIKITDLSSAGEIQIGDPPW
jgi:hypothetical protein